MRACFVNAGKSLANAFLLARPGDSAVALTALPAILAGHEIAVMNYTALLLDVARQRPALRHVVFLGAGACSYMAFGVLEAECGIPVHLIEGHGDTTMAEMSFALMWTVAKGLARMDGGIRRGAWPRAEGVELTGKTVGLLSYGGIAAEMARLCRSAGMRVIAWNRTPRAAESARFVALDALLAESDVLAVHLLLTEATRGFMGRERIGRHRGEHRPWRHARRGRAGRGAAGRATVPRRAGRVPRGTAAARAPADGAGQRHALGALGLLDAGASDKLVNAALAHYRRIAAGGG